MLISSRSRYGLKMMYELALKYGQRPVFLGDIAAAHHISEKYLSKLATALRSAGLVSSFRGARGGYALARDPRTITLREIVEALDGDIAATQGRSHTNGGGAAPEHPTERVWRLLERTVNETLETVSLDSIVLSGRENVPNYEI